MKYFLYLCNMKKIIGIYKITSPTGKIYIGQSIDIQRRFNEYKNNRGCSVATRLYHSLKKYGFENHTTEILIECDVSELNDKEIYFIEKYQSFNTEHGMNLHSGGNNHKVSDETREKQRLSHLGQPAWNKGIKRTEEQKKAQSEKMKGRKASKETKLKMSLAHKGKKHTEETKKKLSQTKLGEKNPNFGKPAWNKGLKLKNNNI
jgi:group I intron endonuclease